MDSLRVLYTYTYYFPWFLLIFIRILAIIYFFPFLGSQNIPWQAKAGLAGTLSLLLLPLLKPQIVEFTLWTLVFGILRELLVGMTLGFVIRLVFDGIQLGGQFIGYQMGFAIVNVIDPYSSTQVSIIARFQGLLALLVFLTLNAHYFLISGLIKSFTLVRLSGWVFNGKLAAQLIRLTGGMFVIAIKIAAPVLVTLIFTHIGLALIARTMPQINVFIVGFPLEIGMGFLMLGLAMPFFAWCFKHVFTQTFHEMLLSLRLMGGY